MQTYRPLILPCLFLFTAACNGTDQNDDTANTGTDSAEAEVGITPAEGDWTFGSGEWVSDECAANFLSTPVGWILSEATETSFELSFVFAETGSLDASPSCTLTGSDYLCDNVTQSFSIGANNITLDADAQGSFGSDTTADLEVAFGIDCSGSGCGNMLAANPCTSIQSFNVFFDD